MMTNSVDSLFKISVIFFLISINLTLISTNNNYSYISLPENHLPYYFNNFPNVVESCLNDDNCEYKDWLKNHDYDKTACWGYETDCLPENRFSKPRCLGEKPMWLKTKEDQYEQFYVQGDFGYVRLQIRELGILCEPLFPHDSMLECSRNLRYCYGRNIMINFTELASQREPTRYSMDVLKPGQIGGYCRFHKQRLEAELDHMSPLQSWAPELRNFEAYNQRPIEANKCDRIIEKPTFLMKIDANINMYHHFCDFFNLYASQHVNMTHPAAFSLDNNIILWETYNYESPFAATFKAFTNNPLLDLRTFKGETVCFKNLVLPLLPRMIFGLYYNTPIISGCENSGIFRAFSEHVLHRLEIPLHKKTDAKIRITLLQRKTKYRQILNADELIDELQKNQSYVIKVVNFERGTKFLDQLEVTRNTDVFIGMHGAGLTHLLFLPNWATLFELWHCEDPGCYRDLSRLRGVNYMTWEDSDKLVQEDEGHHPQAGAHAKFTNYSFDKEEFIRLVNKAADYVLNHKDFHDYIDSNYDNSHTEL